MEEGIQQRFYNTRKNHFTSEVLRRHFLVRYRVLNSLIRVYICYVNVDTHERRRKKWVLQKGLTIMEKKSFFFIESWTLRLINYWKWGWNLVFNGWLFCSHIKKLSIINVVWEFHSIIYNYTCPAPKPSFFFSERITHFRKVLWRRSEPPRCRTAH